MSITEKLLTISTNDKTISDNVQRVYDAGFDAGKAQGGAGGRNVAAQIINKSVTNILVEDLVGCTAIGDYGFYRCVNLTSIDMPNTITTIGNYGFYYCPIQSINLPNTLLTIGDYAFRHCEKITSIYIPASVTSIGKYAFQDTKLKTIHIEDGNNCKILSSICRGCTTLESLHLGNGVTFIADYAFYHCTNLKEITIPETVTQIDIYAFGGNCAVTTATLLPTTPPTLGSSAFTSKLKTIYVPAQSLDAYKSATNWSVYADKMVGV